MTDVEQANTEKTGFWSRVRETFSFRSSTVTPSSPYSTWKSLFNTWGIKGTSVSEESVQGIPAFNRAIEVVGSQIGSLPISVYRKKEDGSVEEAKDHPLYALLKFRPHPLYNSYDFRTAWVRQMYLRGESFVHPVVEQGRTVSLVFLSGKPTIINDGGKFFYRFTHENKTYRAEEVLHFKLNTTDGIAGQSPLALFRETFERALAEIKLGNKYFTNGGQVSGLLSPTQPLDKNQASQAMEFWKQTNTGQDKVGQVGMIPFGFGFTPLGDSMNDNKLMDARRMTTEDISNITGVHSILLGNLDRATFTNVEELNRIFVQFTLRSFGKVFEDEINSKAFSASERGKVFVRLNYDGLLRGDTKARADFYAKLFNVRAISPNEIRAHEGMNPYPGGDAFDLPMASNAKPQQQQNEQSEEPAD